VPESGFRAVKPASCFISSEKHPTGSAREESRLSQEVLSLVKKSYWTLRHEEEIVEEFSLVPNDQRSGLSLLS
jgi:hypothetical protein